MGELHKLHILIISQYFYPEMFRINDMAVEWVKRGYKVTVLTGIPNYPKGKFFDGYGYKQRRSEIWNGVKIIRIPIIPRGRNAIGMTANYFSFVAAGWWWSLSTGIHADLVFTFEVSPMTQALIGCWYRKRFKVPHFMYVQDLWPENVETVTGIVSPIVIKPIDCMADYIYKHTDRIFTTSPSFADAIADRKAGVDKSKVFCWLQYAEEFYKPLDRKQVRSQAKDDSPVRRIPDDGRFRIIFTGNIGTAQGLDILPKTAEKLKDTDGFHKKIQFIIVGDGRYKEQFEAEIRSRRVEGQFLMISRQCAEIIPELLACCDAAFLSFSSRRLWNMTIPAKLQSYMACGMPVIAAAQGETERVIREAQCGVCCRPGDSEGLADAVRALLKADLETMRKNSRKYCEEFFNKASLMDEMDKWINEVG